MSSVRRRARGTDDLRRRRGVVGLSLVGAVNMTLIALRQLGVIRHLPDPPLPGFDADRVTTSRAAYPLGVPDAPLAVAGLALNVLLARAGGGDDRAARAPWLPVVAAVHAGSQATAAAVYFTLMPTKIKAWCAYCLLGAAVNAAVFALTLAEARQGFSILALRGRTG